MVQRVVRRALPNALSKPFGSFRVAPEVCCKTERVLGTGLLTVQA